MNLTSKGFAAPRVCRGIAFGIWTLLGTSFVLGQFALLGWVGPAPVFVAWSVVAIPLLVATGWWLRRYRPALPWRALIALVAVWVALLVLAWLDPFAELRGVAPWTTFVAMLLFPVVLTYLMLAQVEDNVPVHDTA